MSSEISPEIAYWVITPLVQSLTNLYKNCNKIKVFPDTRSEVNSRLIHDKALQCCAYLQITNSGNMKRLQRAKLYLHYYFYKKSGLLMDFVTWPASAWNCCLSWLCSSIQGLLEETVVNTLIPQVWLLKIILQF